VNIVGLNVILVLGFLAAPLASEAQPATRPRVGVLTLGVPSSAPLAQAFRQGLRELGYVEGQSVALEYRFAQGKAERLPAMAVELVRLKVDVIVTESTAAAVAAKQATQTIPIVMALGGDPVKAGLVAGLAQPGGNVTGLTLQAPELSGKRLQVLKDTVPKTDLVAVIYNAANPHAGDNLGETRAAARSLGLRIHPFEVRDPGDLDAAFKAVSDARPSALITLADGMLLGNRTRIVEFAARSRLPGVFPEREFVEVGGLMSYGPSLAANFRRAAAYVDKILKGAKPADLPIEQPRQIELVINFKTAKALGLTIPPGVRARADEVIQ